VSSDLRWIITKLYPFIILPNMAAGPLLFFYFRSITNPDFTFLRKYLLHFVPSLLFFINGTDYLFWNASQKAYLIETFYTDAHAVFNMPTLIFPYYLHVIFRMAQTLIYVVLAFGLFYKVFKLNNYKFSLYQKTPLGYLALFLFFFFAHFITTLIIGIRLNPRFDDILNQMKDLNFLLTLSRTSFTLFILVSLFHPKIVFEKYFIEQAKIVRKPSNPADPDAQKYDMEEIERLFTEYMLTKPCLEMGFSLNSISDGIKLPVHQISYFIKQRYNQSFNDWKNELRIKHAVELIESGKAKQLTLESISMQCGYRSRANFVDAFKKVMNMTPSEYLANQNKS
jgi:AraC-like DNA-binding protein